MVSPEMFDPEVVVIAKEEHKATMIHFREGGAVDKLMDTSNAKTRCDTSRSRNAKECSGKQVDTIIRITTKL